MSRTKHSSREALVAAVIHASRRSATAAVMFHGAIADQHSLTATDTRTLELLDRLGPQSAGEIAAHTGLAATSVTALIDRLEARGLVRRAADANDRRKVLVEPVPQRTAELNQPYAAIASATTSLMRRFDERELAAIAEFLNAGAEYAEKYVASPATDAKRRPGGEGTAPSKGNAR
ncbi:MAG TPA: MarR family transcriptional regulator [Polyangiales bacterium]|nr:MarR family transcriptional regulator [Polyangiales bacterium]